MFLFLIVCYNVKCFHLSCYCVWLVAFLLTLRFGIIQMVGWRGLVGVDEGRPGVAEVFFTTQSVQLGESGGLWEPADHKKGWREKQRQWSLRLF